MTSTLGASAFKLGRPSGAPSEMVRLFVLRAVSPRGARAASPASRAISINNPRAVRRRRVSLRKSAPRAHTPAGRGTAAVNVTRQLEAYRAE